MLGGIKLGDWPEWETRPKRLRTAVLEHLYEKVVPRLTEYNDVRAPLPTGVPVAYVFHWAPIGG